MPGALGRGQPIAQAAHGGRPERPRERRRRRRAETRHHEHVEAGQRVVVAHLVVDREGQPARGRHPCRAADHPDLERVDRAVDLRAHLVRRAEDVEQRGEAGVEAARRRGQPDAHVANRNGVVASGISGRVSVPPAMKVEMLNAGWITAAAGIWRKGDDMERPARIPVPAYLIETAEERILVDTGLHPDAADEHGVFRFEQEASVADQVDLSTVTTVVLTHLHFDHAGGLRLLPAGVPVVVQRREWEAGRDAVAVKRNFYLPGDYAGAEEGGRLVLVDGDHDLLGDGSIRLLLTPGHTPGHQSVQVGERLVIGGDVTHFSSGLDDHRFPSFADDFAAQAASADRLRALRDAGATVRPGHDPAVLAPGPVAV
jgi:N-acyl homoserine lactone hydrolase